MESWIQSFMISLEKIQINDTLNLGWCIPDDEATLTPSIAKPDIDLGLVHNYANKLKTSQPFKRINLMAYLI